MKIAIITSVVLYILCAVLSFIYTYYYSGLSKSLARKEYFWFALIISFLPLAGVFVSCLAVWDWWQRYRPIKDGYRVVFIKPEENWDEEEVYGIRNPYIPTGTKGVVTRAYRALNEYHVDFGWEGHYVATIVKREQIRRVKS